jgi:hypothetical protein
MLKMDTAVMVESIFFEIIIIISQKIWLKACGNEIKVLSL